VKTYAIPGFYSAKEQNHVAEILQADIGKCFRRRPLPQSLCQQRGDPVHSAGKLAIGHLAEPVGEGGQRVRYLREGLGGILAGDVVEDVV
jgi:hypothetical protein